MPSVQALKVLTSSLSVLYVEDEALLRENMENSLKKLFKHVNAVRNGVEAWQAYRENSYDLVISDITMPQMDGIALTQHIKQTHPMQPIIIISGNNESDCLVTLINLGVDRFLNKPVNKEQLIDTLYSVCSSINNAKLALEYKKCLESSNAKLEKQLRILNTQVRKENIRSSNTKKEQAPFEAEQSYYLDINHEDVDELRELNDELDHDIILAFQNDKLTEDYVYALAERYREYGSILCRNPLFSPIGTAVQKLADAIVANMEIFLENISAFRDLLESFNFVMISLRKNVMEQEADDPYFYEPSILRDIELIQNLLTRTDTQTDIEFF